MSYVIICHICNFTYMCAKICAKICAKRINKIKVLNFIWYFYFMPTSGVLSWDYSVDIIFVALNIISIEIANINFIQTLDYIITTKDITKIY